MTVELLSAILVWGGLGLVLDRYLQTRPWFMAIGVLVGFGAGLYLVWLRSSRDLEQHRTAARPRPHDDDQTGAP